MGTRGEAERQMVRDITISTRELTPFEHLVLGLVCEGKSNAAIASQTSHSEKVIENTVSRSAQVFGIKSDSETNKFDIIIQFNQKYFTTNKTLQIMYPLLDNVVYINKVFDIIYGTKNCMFMLYQILKSKYFTDYIEEKIVEKKTLFKIFSKRYFYDYISKIFVIKEIQ